MNPKVKRAITPGRMITPKHYESKVEIYHELSEKARLKRIAERRKQMPRAYRANYDKAVQGKSLRAAVNAFCLECVYWFRKEVRFCTGLACPLYAVRPYQIKPVDDHKKDELTTNNEEIRNV
jgi:hypothetical protein